MNEHTKIENQLQYYLEQFTYLHQLVLEDSQHIDDLENLIDEYSLNGYFNLWQSIII